MPLTGEAACRRLTQFAKSDRKVEAAFKSSEEGASLLIRGTFSFDSTTFKVLGGSAVLEFKLENVEVESCRFDETLTKEISSGSIESLFDSAIGVSFASLKLLDRSCISFKRLPHE